MSSRTGNLLFILLLTLGTIPFVLWSVTASGMRDSGDGLWHWMIAKHTFQYPHLFFDHWGKPLFTLLSAPFAQAGFGGMIAFNIVVALFTAWLGYRIANVRGLAFSFLFPLLLFLQPVYFETVVGGLTEVLFGLLVMVTLYLLIREKYGMAAFVAGLLHFSRPEAIVLIPLITLILLWNRQWKAMLWLPAATLVYSVAGGFFTNDFLWVWTHSPYHKDDNIYGSGPLLHFISQYEKIWGLVILVTALAGVVALAARAVRVKAGARMDLVFLLCGIAGVLALHSWMWYNGSFGSAGLLRVMATVAPLVALLSVYAFSAFAEIFPVSLKWARAGAPSALAAVTVFFSFKSTEQYVQYPILITVPEAAASEVGKKHGEAIAAAPKVAWYFPYLLRVTSIDPYDPEKYPQVQSIGKEEPGKELPSGSIIIWDSKFGPVEGRTPIEKLTSADYLEQIDHILPDTSVKFGDVPFQFYVFRRR